MDIAELTNAPRDIRIGGLTYRVRALTFTEWGEIQAFIKANGDDPVTDAFRQIDKARSKGIAISAESETTLIRDAREAARLWPPQIMTRQWFTLLGETPAGSAKLLHILLRTYQPSITEEQVASIDRQVTSEECQEIVAVAIGLTTPPKGEAPGAGPQTGRKGRRRSKTSGRPTFTG